MEIVKGNDISISWRIYRIVNGVKVPENLTTATDIKVLVTANGLNVPVTSVTVSDTNLLTILIKGRDQITGVYALEVSWVSSIGEDSRVAYGKAFVVVDKQCQADYTLPEGLEVVSLDLYSSTHFGALYENLDVQKEANANQVQGASNGNVLTFDSNLGKWQGKPIVANIHSHENKEILDRITQDLIDNTSRNMVTSTDIDTELTDKNFMSSLRVIAEIVKNNEAMQELFLSKIEPDTAAGLITFLEGIKAKGLSEIDSLNILETLVAKKKAKLDKGFETSQGYGVNIDGLALLKHITLEDGFKSPIFLPGIGGEGVKLSVVPGTVNQWQLELENLIVNGKMSVNTVEVLEWRHVGAGQIYSHAGFKVDKVEELSDRYRLYPENPTMNTFRINSQALCQQFDSDTFGSKRYWRLVIDVAPDRSYIDLSKTVAELGSDIPEVGDNIFAYGYRGTDNTLKGAVIISSYGDGPYIQTLRGIDSFDVSGKTQVFIGSETVFKIDRFEVKSGSSYYRMPVDRGAFVSGTTYNYYDRVSYNGALWVCMINNTVNTPSEREGGWEKQTSVNVGGKNLFREYDLRLAGKYWGITPQENVNYVEVNINNIIANTPYMRVSPSVLNLIYSEYTAPLVVKSNKPWTIDSKPTWTSPTPSSGDGNRSVTVTIQTYTGRINRTGYIIFKSQGLSDNSVYVSQTGKPEFVVIDKVKSVLPSGGQVLVIGKTNSPKLTFTLGAGTMNVTIPNQYSANGVGTNNGAVISGDPGAVAEFNFAIQLTIGQNTAEGSLERTLTVTTNNGQIGNCLLLQTQAHMLLATEDGKLIITEDGKFIDMQYYG